MKITNWHISILFFFQYLPLYAQFKVEKLGPEINTPQYDEISPVLSRDGRTLYFTRVGFPDFNRTLIQDDLDLYKTLSEEDYQVKLKEVYSEIAGENIHEPIYSGINQDIWVADSRFGLFDRVFHPGFPINNALPNSVVSLSPNEQTLVIINHYARDGSMFKGFSFMDRRSDGSFSFPDPIYVHDFYSKAPEVNLCMSKDGDVVIMALDRKEGLGEMDLYVSFKLKYNLWSEPQSMGQEINTSFRELTPFLTEDKSTLYFASNKPGGFGGMDIYKSRRLDFTWTKWSKPELLKAPINSIYDDSNPILIEPHAFLYFTSKRDRSSDIFRLALGPADELEKPITLKGTIHHAHTFEPLDAQLHIGLNKNNLPDQVILAPNGTFEIKLDKKDLYRLSPRKPGFIGKNQLVDVSIISQSGVPAYEIDFFLSPQEEDVKIDLQNIYFERSTPTVLPTSFAELDRLSQMMVDNPSMKIRIEGHTDSVGIFNDLMVLSKARAEAIKNYLVENHAIDAARIHTTGYGATRPIVSNHTESLRAQNRRVEFYITAGGLQKGKKTKYEDLPNPKVKALTDELSLKVIPADKPQSSENIQKYYEVVSEAKPIKSPPAQADSSIPPLRTNQRMAPTSWTADQVTTSPVVMEKSNTSPVAQTFDTIPFVPGTLAIQEDAFITIRRLIDLMINQPEKKINLIGHCASMEEVKDKVVCSLQRAKGIKEFLIFKSIASDRIIIKESTNLSELIGVQVWVE